MGAYPARLLLLISLPLMLLAGCGGIGFGGGGAGGSALPTKTPGKAPAVTPGKPATTDPALHAAYLGITQARSAMFDSRKLLDSTDKDLIPTSGTATYSGIGSVSIETPGAESTALGNAALLVDFGTARISGTMDGFIGRDAADVERAYSGSLQVTGDVGPGKVNNDRFDLAVAGSLISADQTITVNNDLSGGFRGTDYSSLFATTDDKDKIKLDGSSVPGKAQIIAEQ